jgi:hypothetical protein
MATTKVSIAMGRASDTYYLAIRVGSPRDGSYIRINADLTAEQYAQLVTTQQITVDAEVKR